jgi:hypothetical protein
MANPIIKIKRGSTAPSTLQPGELAIDLTNNNFYVGNSSNAPIAIGGEGTFATKTYVDSAVSAGTGSLGTMSTQNADAVAITGGAIDGTTIGATTPSTGAFTTLTATDLSGTINAVSSTLQFAHLFSPSINGAIITTSDIDSSAIGATTPSTGKFTQLDVTGDITMSGSGLIDMNAGRVTNLSAPVSANDAVRKTDLDTAVSALGSVFNYVGEMNLSSGAWIETDLSNVTTGDYYRITGTGEFKYGGGAGPSGATMVTLQLKAGDALVKTTTDWQKIDNVDAEVLPTANEIAVTGDENVGYTVSIDPVFSGRVLTAETDITDLETKTQNIDLAGTTSGTTQINGDIKLNGTTGATFIKATPGGRGIIVGDATDEEMFLSASGGFGVVSAIGPNLTHLTLNGSKVNIGGSFDPSVWPPTGNSTDDATEVTINAVTVKGSASGTTTLENFVIDGGVY